ncbi:hypothetical protein FMK90_08020 [Klebsiella grimontii]|nr:hypothetical protein F0332_08300 [Klebsiella grimontii]MBX4738212.1 hypothetical protein [Klebsiella sp. CVUAS 10975.2]MBZ6568142.1 hypothetical protein [Klebsiella grimontii]MBZ6728014.1 hypothetical protein [Klebsiella grimontii]MBZ7124487.1 hypothetical protein [Klebsiella grimontii]
MAGRRETGLVIGCSPYHCRLCATAFGHQKTLDEYPPLRVSKLTFCSKTEKLPASEDPRPAIS